MPQPQRPHPPCPRHQLRPGNGLRLRDGRRTRPKRCTSTACWSRRRVLDPSSDPLHPRRLQLRRRRGRRPNPRRADAASPGRPMADFKAAGKLILGICNGFQVIIKSGILAGRRSATRSRPPRSPATIGQFRGPLGPSQRRRLEMRIPSAASSRCTSPSPTARAVSSPARPK